MKSIEEWVEVDEAVQRRHRLHLTVTAAAGVSVGLLVGSWVEPSIQQQPVTVRSGFVLACEEDEVAAPMLATDVEDDVDGLRWECVHVESLQGVEFRGRS